MTRSTVRIELEDLGRRIGAPENYPYLPVSLANALGQVLTRAVVSAESPARLSYERADAPVFARMTLPNGATLTEPLRDAELRWRDVVRFRIDADKLSDRWMAWSAARLDAGRQAGALRNVPGMMEAWFQLWELEPRTQRWHQARPYPEMARTLGSSDALQMLFLHGGLPRALVVRLDSDNPLVVSLPTLPTKVLITTERTLSGEVRPKVTIGDFSANAEAILEYLRLGRVGAMETLLDPGSELSHRLLKNKVEDPFAATAAAYYLLRKRNWDRLPEAWLRNLDRLCAGRIPDTRLILAMSQIERGMPMSDAAALAVETLAGGFEQGFPLFAEASWLLGDLLALADKAERPLERRTRNMLGTMLGTANHSGLSFCFAGSAPNRPMSAKEAFERRQKRLGDTLLSEAVREVFDLADATELSSTTRGERRTPASRDLRAAADRLRAGLETIRSTSPVQVPGNRARTLFLSELLAPDR